MIISRSTKAALLLSLCAVSIAAIQQDGVSIRRQLKANSKESYKVQTVTKISADTPVGAQEGSANSLSTIETTVGAVKPDGNTADYTMITTTEKIELDGVLSQAAGAIPDKVPPVTVKGMIDIFNKLSGAKIQGNDVQGNPMSMLGGSEAAQMGLFVQFPDKPVNENDTWTITIPASPMMGKTEQKLTAKYLGTKDFNGQKVYVVNISGTLAIEPDMEAMKKANKSGTDPTMGMDIKVKGTADMDSENLIDPATGATLQATTHVKGKTDVEIVQMAMTSKVTTDTTVKMTLSK